MPAILLILLIVGAGFSTWFLWLSLTGNTARDDQARRKLAKLLAVSIVVATASIVAESVHTARERNAQSARMATIGAELSATSERLGELETSVSKTIAELLDHGTPIWEGDMSFIIDMGSQEAALQPYIDRIGGVIGADRKALSAQDGVVDGMFSSGGVAGSVDFLDTSPFSPTDGEEIAAAVLRTQHIEIGFFSSRREPRDYLADYAASGLAVIEQELYLEAFPFLASSLLDDQAMHVRYNIENRSLSIVGTGIQISPPTQTDGTKRGMRRFSGGQMLIMFLHIPADPDPRVSAPAAEVLSRCVLRYFAIRTPDLKLFQFDSEDWIRIKFHNATGYLVDLP